MALILRPRQETFIEEIRGEFDAGFTRVMAVAPTGFGKTVCFSYIATAAAAIGNRIWILVHRKELIKQTSRSLMENGIPHGVIAAGFPEMNFPIQVCSVQTLVRRLNRYRIPDLIVIDEGHHCTAPQYTAILEWAVGALILAVTATPIRRDGRGFDHYRKDGERVVLMQRLVLGPNIDTLVREKWLAEPVLYVPKIDAIDLSKVETGPDGEHKQGQLGVAMDKPTIVGSAIDHYHWLLPHHPPTVYFQVSVDSARHAAAQFSAAGIPAESIDGTLDDEQREAIIRRLDTGETRCLMSCNLVDEGFDLPKIEAVGDLSPTKAMARWLQRLGRGMRPYPGKTQCKILDHVGNSSVHEDATLALLGIEPDALQWTLEGRRKRPAAKGGSLTTCPKCFRAFRRAIQCPGCGHILQVAGGGTGREIEQVDGQLVRLDASALKRSVVDEPKPKRPRNGAVIKTLERITEE